MTSQFPWPSSDERLLDAIYEWMVRQRWYPGGADDPKPHIVDTYSMGLHDDVRIPIVELHDGTLLQVPLAMVTKEHNTVDVIAEVGTDDLVIIDGTSSVAFLHSWLQDVDYAHSFIDLGKVDLGALHDSLWATYEQAYAIGREQSNTSVVFGEATPAAIVKFFRVLVDGPQPEVDIPVGIAKTGWDGVPLPLAATYKDIHVNGQTKRVCTASMYQFIDGATDGFDYMCDLVRSHDEADQRRALEECRAIGAMTAAMHRALKNAFGEGDYMSGVLLSQRIIEQRDLALEAYPDLAHEQALLDGIADIITSINNLGQLPPTQRVHGDFHLGQCLRTQDRWYVLDFEGEPLRPVRERILPDQPTRDIAGMLRSLDYVVAMADGSQQWRADARQAFVDGYFCERGDKPSAPALFVINAMEVEKVLYELRYEALHRPHMVHIPLHALHELFPSA